MESFHGQLHFLVELVRYSLLAVSCVLWRLHLSSTRLNSPENAFHLCFEPTTRSNPPLRFFAHSFNFEIASCSDLYLSPGKSSSNGLLDLRDIFSFLVMMKNREDVVNMPRAINLKNLASKYCFQKISEREIQPL